MKERQSNMELLRIIAMLMIVLQHANYGALGPIDRDSIIVDSASSIIRMFFQQFCIIGVNVFVLLSGWYGIKPSISGFFRLIYQIVFFGLLIPLIGFVIGIPVPIKDSLYVLYGGGYYWFVPAYLGLYCLSPVLNIFVEKVSAKTQLKVLIFFFLLEFAFGWLTSHYTYNNGYSIVSFIGLYLLAGFVNHHSSLKTLKPSTLFLGYIVFTIIPVVLAFFGYKYLNRGFFPTEYCSPFVISASLFFFLCFSRLHFSNKTINWIACSVFPVYIAHQHPVLAQYFNSLMKESYLVMSDFCFIGFALLVAIALIFICAFVDKVRLVSWRFLYRTLFNKIFTSLDCCINAIVMKIVD